jgi:hypothetical protein
VALYTLDNYVDFCIIDRLPSCAGKASGGIRCRFFGLFFGKSMRIKSISLRRSAPQSRARTFRERAAAIGVRAEAAPEFYAEAAYHPWGGIFQEKYPLPSS